MFGKIILNGKQLCQELGISTTLLYRLLKQGMPYHQLSTASRKYYNLDEKRVVTKGGFSSTN